VNGAYSSATLPLDLLFGAFDDAQRNGKFMHVAARRRYMVLMRM
jgi:hypothetical protein